MSWFAEAFKAVATVGTDIVAKTTKLAVNGAAEVAGIFDEKAKRDVQKAALQAEQNIRRNPVIDAINEINNNERSTTKELVRYIDTTMDIDESETFPKFVESVTRTDLHLWAVRAYIPYFFHELHTTNSFVENKATIIERCKESTEKLEIPFEYVSEAVTDLIYNWSLIFSDKDCYLVHQDTTCIVGFCGTKFNDFDHLLADATIGNLVAGYHYKMADIASMYWDQLSEKILKFDKIYLVGHSLGAGVATYMNILLYAKAPEKIVVSYGFGVPCILPRVFKNRLSRRIINVIDIKDPVPKYYKNENVAHANNLVQIDSNDYKWRWISQFNINWNRFNPLNQFAKFEFDKKNLDSHYMKNYISILQMQKIDGFLESSTFKAYEY